MDENGHLSPFSLDFGSKKDNLDDYLLVAVDGVQYFNSHTVYPFVQFNRLSEEGKTRKTLQKDKKHTYIYEFANKLILNGDNQDILVNFVRFQEIDNKTGEILTMEWITDIPLCIDNIQRVVKAGRARWKIENEAFNTLKNQGYHYEHNFGHGKKYLAQNLAQLMLLAFTFDQIQHLLSPLFNQALRLCQSKKMLWLKVREVFDLIPCENMEMLYKIITKEHKVKIEIMKISVKHAFT